MSADALRDCSARELHEEQCSDVLLDPTAAAAKRRQNITFKYVGSFAWFFGVGGFVPSSIMGLYHGVPWMVSSWKPHDHVDNWLIVHCFCMWVWVTAVAVQFWSGGRPHETMKLIHRCTGYVGFLALSCGLLCGGIIWTLKHDFAASQLTPGYYTIIVSIFAEVNILVSVNHARQGRTGDHKDFMLMAFMWTMDPAVQRTAMYLLRYALHIPNTLPTFTAGKLCGNVFLTLVFLYAAVRSKRENMAMVLNVAGQWIFGLLYTVAVLVIVKDSDMEERDTNLVTGIGIFCGSTLAIVGLVYAWFRAGWLRRWRPDRAQKVALAAWLLAVGGLVLTFVMPQTHNLN